MVFHRSFVFLAACLLGVLVVPTRAQQDGDVSLETELLEIFREKGYIDASEYEELMVLARQRASARANEVTLIESSLQRLAAPDVQVRGGTPTKLIFRSPDGKWSLGIKGQIQARIEDYNSDDDTQDDTNISVPRARLTAEGNAGSPNVRYKLTIDAPTNKNNVNPATEPVVNVRDAYVDMSVLEDAQGNFRLGQFKFPFGRDMMTSSGALSFQERSIASAEFSPNFEPAAMIYGQPFEGLFEWYAALANGEGRSKNNTAGDELNGMRKGVRGVWNPLGPVKLEGPAFQTLTDGSTKVAFGAEYMVNEDSANLNTATENGKAISRGMDVAFYWGGFSSLFEAFSRDSNTQGGVDADDRGNSIQAGYFVVPDKWELVARYSRVNYSEKDDAEERTLGLNWYLDRNNGKWQLDWSGLTNEGATPDATRVRVQYQVLF
jgi:phosphate-selective porin